MATTTKTLRTSGGDFSTITELNAYMDGVSDLADDIVINIEGGATFAGRFVWVGNSSRTGALITIQTDPAEQATPAQIYNDVTDYHTFSTTQSSTYEILVQNLKFRGNANAGDSRLLQASNSNLNKYVTVQNCFIVHSNVSNGLIVASNNMGAKVFNNTIVIYDSTSTGSMIYHNANPANDLNGQFANNIVIYYKNSTVSDIKIFGNKADAAAGTRIAHNNYFYNAGSGAITLNTDYDGTSSSGNVVDVDPENVEALIQSLDESSATIIARNYGLQSDSPCVNTADETYAPATDIIGTVRPQGVADDIGCKEYLTVVVPEPEATPAAVVITKNVVGVSLSERIGSRIL